MLQIVLLHGIEYVSFAFPYTDWYYLFEFFQGEKDMGTGKIIVSNHQTCNHICPQGILQILIGKGTPVPEFKCYRWNVLLLLVGK